MVESLLIVLVALAAVTLFLIAFSLRQIGKLKGSDTLTKDAMAQILRSEAELTRKGAEDQARNARQELSYNLNEIRDSLSKAFSIFGQGIDLKVRVLNEELALGVTAIDSRICGMGDKVDADVTRFREDAGRDRDALRDLFDIKLDGAAAKQAEAAKQVREELGQGLQIIRDGLITTLGEVSEHQKERFDTAKVTIDRMARKLDLDMAQMGESADKNRETLRTLVEVKLETASFKQAEEAKGLREELGRNFQHLGGHVSSILGEMSEQQRERLDKSTSALDAMGEKNEKSSEALRKSVEERLDAIRVQNASKLDEMRQTVDEKLHSTLESRLGESFNRVVD